jgi:hypothetical protein
MLIKLFLEALEKGKRVGCASREAGYNLVFIESPDFTCVAFEHSAALGYLAITTDDNCVASADRDYRCTSVLFQSILLVGSRIAALGLISVNWQSGSSG